MAITPVSIVNVWKRVMDLGKSGTSGMDSQDEFNGKVDSVQKSLVQMLLDVTEENQKVTDALNWLKKPSGNLTSDATGLITLPNDYLYLDSVSFVGTGGALYPTDKLRTNQLNMTRTSPIRKPDPVNNSVDYYFKQNNMYVMPEQAGIVINFLYYIQVPVASIVLTPQSTDNSDFLAPTAGTEFGWPTSMFNILVYMILQQFGVELKEQWLVEFADYGISTETIKTAAK